MRGLPVVTSDSFSGVLSPPLAEDPTDSYNVDERPTGSARSLISLYEQNKSTNPVRSRNPYALPTRAPTMHPKQRLPIRNSFRNILTVFGVKKERVEDIGTGPYVPVETDSTTQGIEAVTADTESLKSTSSNETFNIAHQGPLLHLDSHTEPPRWHSCNAILHASHLSLRWAEVDGGDASRDMVLALCTNVKSVAASSLDPDMSPSLQCDNPAHVFVMEFGKNEERFATHTVTDRAMWVNVIWDALLRCREFSISVDQHDTMKGAEEPVSEASLSSPAFRVISSPPSKSVSGFTTPRSPSIDRLDNSTIVKQRLAQFERHSSVQHSTWKSSRSRSVIEGMPVSSVPFSVLDAAFWSGNGSHSTMPRGATKDPLVEPRASSRIRHNIVDASRLTNERTTPVNESQTCSLPPQPVAKDPVPSTSLEAERKAASHIPSHGISTKLNVARHSHVTPSKPNDAPIPRDSQSVYDLVTQYSAKHAVSIDRLTSCTETLQRDLSTATKDILSAVRRPDVASKSIIDKLDKLDVQSLHVKLEKLTAQTFHDIPRRERSLPPTPVATTEVHPTVSVINESKKDSSATDITPVLDKLESTHVILQTGLAELKDAMVTRKEWSTMTTNLERISTPADVQSSDFKDIEAMLSEIMQKLDIVAALSTDLSRRDGTLRDGPASTSVSVPSAPKVEPVVSLSELTCSMSECASEKIAMDATEMFMSHPSTSTAGVGNLVHSKDGNAAILTELKRLSTLMNESAAASEKLGSQHSDSVRYLNDLNNWLATYAENANGNLEYVHMQIVRLQEELGVAPALRITSPELTESDDNTVPSVQTLSNMDPTDTGREPEQAAPVQGLLNDMREFLASQKGHPQVNHPDFHSSIHTLFTGVAQELDRNAHDRSRMAADTLLGYMEQQRQANEALLRSIAADLSNDIRGERLRFIEAMQEATSVNVQMHVEAFRKELSKEVINMTVEVERLAKERQILQVQISELFAFFSKQKPVAVRETQSLTQTMANLPRRRRP